MYKTSLIFTLLTTAAFLKAQVPSFELQPMPEQYQEVKPTVLFQAGNRYIWVGTEQGLFRFDGLDYQPFLMPDSICNNKVTAIGEIGDRLWVGYEDGCVFFQAKAKFQLWQIE
jgi:ligand-binding sensor domain-containing protein